MSFKKNTAAKLFFCLVDASDGSAMTGASVTAKRSIDGGAQADTTGSVSEIGLGQYVLAGAAADFNGAEIGFLFTASGAVPVSITVHTDTKIVSDLNDAPDVSSNVSAIKGKTDNLPASPAAVGSQMNLADGAIKAAKIDAGALDNKGNWNVGKTGYSLTATTGLGNQTANITGNLSGSVGSIASDGLSAASIKSDAVTKIQSGLSTLDAGGVRSAIGMSSANLDTQLSGIPAAVWNAATSGLTTAGSIGKLLVDNITAKVGDVAAAVWSVATRALTDKTGFSLTSAYDAAKNAAAPGDAMTLTGAYDAAKTAAQAGDAMALTSTERTTLTGVVWAALTSGLTTAGSIGKLIVDNLNATISGIASAVWGAGTRTLTSGAAPSTSDIADAVWDEALSGHTTAGSAGNALAAAGIAGDPLTATVPGSYPNGSAGYAMGQLAYVADKVGVLTSGAPIINQSAVVSSGDRYMYIGADHVDNDVAWVWTDTADDWPDLTNYTVNLYVRKNGNLVQAFSVTKVIGGAHQELRVEPLSAVTSEFAEGSHEYTMWITNTSDERKPLFAGTIIAVLYPRA